MTMRTCLTVVAALSLSAATAGGTFDVRAFGAKGDGLAKDTASIQAAIDAAEKAGGGEVYLGAGTYLSGSVYLKDNVDFHLGPGAVLLGSANPLDYNDPYGFRLNNPIWPSESSFGAHLLVCYERKNVTVRGPGRIDGNAKAFLVSPEGKVYDQGSIPWRPSQMLWFCQSEDVRVTDLEIANSTQWSCFFHGCDRVKVRGCRVHNNRFRRGTFHTHNGDGIDVDSCRWVSISDCDIDVADDGITLRASPRGEMRNRECAFVTVSNCRISSECNAVRVGVGNGRIHDAVFSNLSIYETRIAFNFSSSWSRGSHGCDFEDIRFENCALDCGQFLYVDPIYSTKATIGNISFSGLTGKSYLPGRINWNDPKLCGRILLRDVDLGCDVRTRNTPELEIAGGTLKRSDLPEGEAARREWDVADWGGYSDWGDSGYRKYANRKWKLVWSDEFDGEKLDETKWVCERGIIRNPGTEHTYTDDPENVRVEKGVLVLEARRKTVQNPNYEPGSADFRKAKETHYTSGSVETLGKYDFTYGRVEVRAKVPAGRGMWPAIWMMGANITKYGWPRCGELDVMEFVGSDPGGVYGTMHWFDPVHPQKPSAKTGGTTSFGQRLEKRTPTDGFHVYAIEWDRDEIVFYYDNERYFTYDVNLATLQGTGPVGGEYNPFRLPMYLKLNLALGGGWAGKVDPACVPGRFEVDYVRVYERAQDVSVKSPDGRNEIVLSRQADGSLTWRVSRDGKPVLAPAALGLDLSPSPKAIEGDHVVRFQKSGTEPTPVYKKGSIDHASNWASVRLAEDVKVELVARNDGVAWRFVLDGRPDARIDVVRETADVRFADRASMLYAGVVEHGAAKASYWTSADALQHSSETPFVKTTPVALMAGRTNAVAYLPLTGRTTSGAWFAVKDTDVRDYPGWQLQRAGEDFRGVFAAEPDPAQCVRTGVFCRVTGRLGRLASVSRRRTLPWRCVLLADTPGGLAEADALYALAEGPKGDFSWVKPGLCAWDWWCAHNIPDAPGLKPNSAEEYCHYIDFAAANGIPYFLIDGGWLQNNDLNCPRPGVDLPKTFAYAKKKGVKVIVWCAWVSLLEDLEQSMARFAAMGCAGFKIDFLDRDDVLASRFMWRAAAAAAEKRLVIDFHGCPVPNGLQRTYPNVLNFEAVRGLENAKWDEAVRDFPPHDVRLVFTRFLAGPADYTPGAFLNRTREGFMPTPKRPCVPGTRAHQMALYTLYEAPLQMLCDSPTQYRASPECLKFLTGTPATWDETRVLSGSPDDFAVMARRRGEVWQVGAITDWTARELELGTSFLGEGQWTLESFADAPDAGSIPEHFTHERRTVSAPESLRLKLAPGGGWTGRFVRK